MSKRNSARRRPQANGEAVRAAVNWVVEEGIFQGLEVHGNTKWRFVDLVVLGVLWVWSDHPTLTGAFAEARRRSLDMLGRVAVGSYQGLTGALVTWTGELSRCCGRACTA